MPISGVTILASRNRVDTIKDEIEKKCRSEVTCEVAGHLVVVLETETAAQMKERLQAVAHIPGVISTQVAYYHHEEMIE